MDIDPEGDLVSEESALEVAKKPVRSSRAALAMKIHGANDVEIAEMLDYASPQSARAAWEEALASTVDPTMDYKALRGLRTAQLEAGLKSLAPRALNEYIREADPDDPTGKKKIRVRNDEHLAYSQMFLRYMDRIIRVQGLDAPQVVSLVTPGVAEFEEVVSRLALAATGAGAEEGDIFAEGPDGVFEKIEEADDDEAPY